MEARYAVVRCVKTISIEDIKFNCEPPNRIIGNCCWKSNSDVQIYFLTFQNTAIVEDTHISEYEIENKGTVFSIDFINDDSSIKPTNEIYLYLLPEIINHSASILSFVHMIDPEALMKHPPGLFVVTPSSPKASILLQLILPRVDFGNNRYMKMEVGDSYRVPYLLLQNYPEGVTKEELIFEYAAHGFKFDFIEVIPNSKLNNSTAEIILPSNELAQKFTDKFNYSIYKGNVISIKHYLSPKQLEELKKWRIKINGIKRNTTPKQIETLFKPFGEIFSINITDSTGILEFKERESAEKAVNTPPPGLSLSFLLTENTKMIVMNLPIGVTCNQIKEFFPNSIHIKIVESKYDGVRPVAHLTYSDKDEMMEAIEEGNKISCNGMRLFCMQFKEFHDKIGDIQKSMTKENSVFVINIPSKWNMENIVQALKHFGDIVYIKFSAANKDKTGFAGVLFNKASSVVKALKSPNIKGVSIKLYQKK